MPTNIKDVGFLQSDYLRFFYVVVALLALWIGAYLIKRLNAPAKTKLSRYPALPKIKLWLFAVFVLAVTIVALARPFGKGEILELRGGSVDVIVVIDRSISMAAKDLGETRLAVVQREGVVLAKKILKPGDRVSVFTFGTDSFRKLYPSKDRERFLREIQKLRFSPYLLKDETLWNTNLAIAMEHLYESVDRQNALESQDKNRREHAGRPRVVFLFSDGDDQAVQDFKLYDALNELRKRKIKVYPIGIGTRHGYPLVRVLDGYRPGIDYDATLDAEWKSEYTKLQLETLELIAKDTGGRLYTIEKKGSGAYLFMRNAIDSNRHFSLIQPEKNTEFVEFWWYVVWAAIAIILLAIIFH